MLPIMQFNSRQIRHPSRLATNVSSHERREGVDLEATDDNHLSHPHSYLDFM